MRNANDRLMDIMLESLNDCGLSKEQMEEVESYLDGSRDDCRLSVKRITDLLSVGGNVNAGTSNDERRKKVEKCFDRLEKTKDDELLKRYLYVTFEIFGATLHPVLSWRNKEKSMLSKPQRIALRAQQTGDVKWTFNGEGYKRVREISRDSEDFKKALEYTKPDDCNGDLVIYTAMFYEGENKKFWNGHGLAGRSIEMSEFDGERQEEITDNSAADDNTVEGSAADDNSKENRGLLKRISGLLSGKSDSNQENKTGLGKKIAEFEKSTVVKDYKEQFERYEKLIAHNSYAVYGASFSEAQINLIRDYILNGGDKPVPADIISFVRITDLKDPLAAFLIGCAAPNYRLSPVLYRFLKVCMSGDHHKRTFDLMDRTECRKDMEAEAIHWYADFAPDDKKFIEWAGNNDMDKVLTFIAKKNPETYINTAKASNLELYKKLTAPLKSGVGIGFYMKHFADVFAGNQTNVQAKVIKDIVTTNDSKVKAAVSDYLYGEKPIEEIYQYEDVFSHTAVSCQPVISYRDVYGEDDFYVRCVAFLGMNCGRSGRAYSLRHLYNHDWSTFSGSGFERFYENMKKGGLDTEHCIKTISDLYYSEWNKAKMIEPILRLFGNDLKENREEAVKAFMDGTVDGRILGIKTLSAHAYQNKNELMAYLGDSSKQVREELVKVLSSHPKMADDIINVITSSKKAAERETAAMILSGYDNVSEYNDTLMVALEKEKSKKAAEYIKKALAEGGALEETAGEEGTVSGKGSSVGKGAAGNILTVEGYIKECHKGGRKRSLEWLYKEPLPQVHYAAHEDNSAPDEEYMQAILLAYAGMSTPGVNREVHILTDNLNRDELNAFMDEVYERWLLAGAEAKKKWVLYAASIHGGSRMVYKLQHQINEWAGASRGAIAAEAVKALSLNDSPMALVTVDNIARKYKYKQVKKAANEALRFAAGQLNLTVEELADKIVPDLDFDENMERHFDYGIRTFTVRISPALEIEVTDENGKVRKALPAAGKNDDAEKAKKALDDFKELKKQMRTTVKNQAMRLELALSVDRRWTVEGFENLFVKNPVMHQFAISLIWGYYEDGKLVKTFRYMEDGTFNTVDEEEY